MQTVFTTADVEPRHRYDYWHNIACKRLINHDSTPVDIASFRADLKCGNLGELEFVQFENSPMSVTHTLQHVAEADAQFLYICRQAVGRLSLQHNDQSVLLQSGDLVLVEPRMPYSCFFADESRTLVVKIPRDTLTDRLKNHSRLIGRAIPRTPGESAMTSGFMALLPNHVGRLGPAASQLAANYLIELFALAASTDNRGQMPAPPALGPGS